MADITTTCDNASKALDSTAARPLESASQAMSQPGEANSACHNPSPEAGHKLVNTGVLPDTLILDDADRPASGRNSMSAAATEKAAEDIARVIKENHNPETFGENVGNAINQSVKDGANLTELVQDLNKDLATNTGWQKFDHASLKTDASGNESLLIKTAPFGGTQFSVHDNQLGIGMPLK